ncbi:hypothetical protein QBC39DRAFT_110806 [Podospora conica]|nr:hypothetical protein QBC39DRAFT_110806 [Schizothecium conicum]
MAVLFQASGVWQVLAAVRPTSQAAMVVHFHTTEHPYLPPGRFSSYPSDGTMSTPLISSARCAQYPIASESLPRRPQPGEREKRRRRRQRKGRDGMYVCWADRPSTIDEKIRNVAFLSVPPHHAHDDATTGPSVHLMSRVDDLPGVLLHAVARPFQGNLLEPGLSDASRRNHDMGSTPSSASRPSQKCHPPGILFFTADSMPPLRLAGCIPDAGSIFRLARKCNHGIFPRPSAPLGAAPRQKKITINGARNAGIVICCQSGSGSEKEARRPSLPSQPSHVIGLAAMVSLAPTRHAVHTHTHSVHGFPRPSPFRFRLMSCLLPIRPHWIQGFRRRTVCVNLSTHSMPCKNASGRPVVIDTQVAGKFDTRTIQYCSGLLASARPLARDAISS